MVCVYRGIHHSYTIAGVVCWVNEPQKGPYYNVGVEEVKRDWKCFMLKKSISERSPYFGCGVRYLCGSILLLHFFLAPFSCATLAALLLSLLLSFLLFLSLFLTSVPCTGSHWLALARISMLWLALARTGSPITLPKLQSGTQLRAPSCCEAD